MDRRFLVATGLLSALAFGATWVAAGTVSKVQSLPSPPEHDPLRALPVSVYYRNCDAARAAGAAPMRHGAPGYRAELDRDRDGVACEPYRRKVMF